MKKTKKSIQGFTRRRVFFLGLASVLILILGYYFLATVPLPGNVREREKKVEISAFVDQNANGNRDSDEPGLENVLVYAIYNQHGAFMRPTTLTDSDGQSTLTGTYTHFFDVEAVPPCGYRATTAQSVDGLANRYLFRRIEFGFAPEMPRAGTATIRFHMWYDQNRNGIWDDDEIPWDNPTPEGGALPNLTFRVNLFGADARRLPDWLPDDLAIIPDSNGEALLNLGNSCGALWVLEPDYWVTTGTTPEPTHQPDYPHHPEKHWVSFVYDLGETEIWWGAVHWRDRGTE